jgi:hypothetical protein
VAKKKATDTEIELFFGPLDGKKMMLSLPQCTTVLSIPYGDGDDIAIYKLTGERWEYEREEGKQCT